MERCDKREGRRYVDLLVNLLLQCLCHNQAHNKWRFLQMSTWDGQRNAALNQKWWLFLISLHPFRSFQQAAPSKSARTECVSVGMLLSISSGQLPPQMFYWIRSIAFSQGSKVFSGSWRRWLYLAAFMKINLQRLEIASDSWGRIHKDSSGK